MSHASSSPIKQKKKFKRNIKSRKMKRKILVFKVFYNKSRSSKRTLYRVYIRELDGVLSTN